MNCGACGHETSRPAKFCEECGASLRRVCPTCGAEARAESKFCEGCGSRLASGAPPLPEDPRSYTPPHLASRILAEQAAMEARGAADGERKTITALFADLKGSTALIEGLDPEEARAIIDPRCN